MPLCRHISYPKESSKTRIISKIVEFVATAKFKFVTAKITFPWK